MSISVILLPTRSRITFVTDVKKIDIYERGTSESEKGKKLNENRISRKLLFPLEFYRILQYHGIMVVQPNSLSFTINFAFLHDRCNLICSMIVVPASPFIPTYNTNQELSWKRLFMSRNALNGHLNNVHDLFTDLFYQSSLFCGQLVPSPAKDMEGLTTCQTTSHLDASISSSSRRFLQANFAAVGL